MTRKLASLLSALVVIACFGSTAQAALLASESFNYDTNLGTFGNLSGQSGGTGWTNNWSNDTTRTAVFDSTSSPMTYTITTGVTVDGGNRALRTRDNVANNRSFPSQNLGDVYVSFLFRYESGLNTQFSQIRIGNAFIGFRGVAGAGDLSLKMGSQDAGGAASAQDSSIDVVAGTTYFIIAKLSKSVADTSAQYNTGTLWVNPTSTDETQGIDGVATGNAGTSLSNWQFFGDNNSNSNLRNFDEIRIGTTFADVIPAPIPEPASLALLVCGSMLLIARRRR